MAKAHRICSISECGKIACNGRGWCRAHYERWKRHGDPLGGGTARGAPMRWLQTHSQHQAASCLIWHFGTLPDGYGVVRYKGRAHTAHYVMCELAHGPRPSSNYEAAHSCGNRICTNPRHLRWATSGENAADKIGHGTVIRGSQVPVSKLTEADVLLIRAQKGKAKVPEIAARFGVSKHNIYSIFRRELWGWLE